MENNIIAEYLNSRKIDAKQECSGIYVFRRPFTDDWVVKSVKTILFVIEGLVHVIVELPVQQINRDIGYRILSEICWINYELEPHQNYEYSPTSKMFYFHSSISATCSAEELSVIIEQSIEIVSEDIQTISDAITKEAQKWAVENLKQKRSEKMMESSAGGVQPLSHYRNTGVKSRWRGNDNRDVVSFSQLQEMILHGSHGQVVLMEGPTTCGKSLVIRQLKERVPNRVAILTVEDMTDRFIDIIMHRDESKFRAKIGICDIVCFENIDMLRTSSTQNEAAHLFDELAKQQKAIVLNGIECTKRTPSMLQRIKSPLQIFRFIQNDGE